MVAVPPPPSYHTRALGRGGSAAAEEELLRHYRAEAPIALLEAQGAQEQEQAARLQQSVLQSFRDTGPRPGGEGEESAGLPQYTDFYWCMKLW